MAANVPLPPFPEEERERAQAQPAQQEQGAPQQQQPHHQAAGGTERRKPGRPAVHNGCQVCGSSLEGMRMFHQRYHICNDHMQIEQLMWKGILQRFCQQCGRFHPLEEFDPGVRSCRKQLAKHAERRRRGRERAAAERAQLLRLQQQAKGLVLSTGHEGRYASAQDAAQEEEAGAPGRSPNPFSPAAEEQQQPQQQQQQALVNSRLPKRLADNSSYSGVSTGMHQPDRSMSPSGGGLGALLSAAEAEEAAARLEGEAGVDRRSQEEEEGEEEGVSDAERQQAWHARKQPRLALEPDLRWFASAPPPGSPLPLAAAPISALTSSNEGLLGSSAAVLAATATAAANPAGSGGSAMLALALQQMQQLQRLQEEQQQQKQQLQQQQQLAALQQAASRVLSQLPQSREFGPGLPALQQQILQQPSMPQQQGGLLTNQKPQEPQQQLLQYVQLLAAGRGAVAPLPAFPPPPPPLPPQQQDQDGLLAWQREQHVSNLFQAAVQSLMQNVLGAPPMPPFLRPPP